MKHFTPALLTAFSVLTLSFSVVSKANNIDSDGFVVFKATTTEAPPASSDEATGTKQIAKTESAVKEKKPVVKEPVVQEVTAEKPVVKKEKEIVKGVKKKAKKRATRTVRQTRAKRATRATRAQRNKSLRRASFYRVRSGDTLYRISVKSGVSLSRLVRLNKLYGSKKNNIQAGQKLRLR